MIISSRSEFGWHRPGRAVDRWRGFWWGFGSIESNESLLIADFGGLCLRDWEWYGGHFAKNERRQRKDRRLNGRPPVVAAVSG